MGAFIKLESIGTYGISLKIPSLGEFATYPLVWIWPTTSKLLYSGSHIYS